MKIATLLQKVSLNASINLTINGLPLFVRIRTNLATDSRPKVAGRITKLPLSRLKNECLPDRPLLTDSVEKDSKKDS